MMQSIGDHESSTTSAAVNTTSAPTTSSNARDEAEPVSNAMILACCDQGDITKLRLWTSLGVDVLFSEQPLMRVATYGMVDGVHTWFRSSVQMSIKP
jgi:hypothetical protein